MKIILGTANFSQDYGFRKKSIRSINKINKILNYCKKNKIKFLDTAVSYIKDKNIEKKIAKSGLKIITKFSIKDLNINHKNKNDFSTKFQKKLNITDTNNVYAVLLHDYKDLINKKYRYKILNELKNLKKKKKIKKIGVSVYDPSDLQKVIKHLRPDIIQLPINPLNQSFLKNNILKKLIQKKIEIHVRSVFLQGMLLMKYNDLPYKFKKKQSIIMWNRWCTKNKIKKLEACTVFIKSIKEIDKVVIGVDNLKNLKQIFHEFCINKKKIRYNFSSFNFGKKEDLRKW